MGGASPQTPLPENPTRHPVARAGRDYPKRDGPDPAIDWPGQGEAWPRSTVEQVALNGIEFNFGDAWHDPAGYVQAADDLRLWRLVEWMHFVERGGGLLDETARNPVGVIRSHLDRDPPARPGPGGAGLPRRDINRIRQKLRRVSAHVDDIPY